MFTIDYKSRAPLYEQLIESVRARVLSGALQGDDPMPSVRQLSGQLGINPNTVQKAYAILEQQGILYSVPGKGSFVRPDTDGLRHRQTQELFSQLTDLARRMQQLGIDREAALGALSSAFDKEGNHD